MRPRSSIDGLIQEVLWLVQFEDLEDKALSLMERDHEGVLTKAIQKPSLVSCP